MQEQESYQSQMMPNEKGLALSITIVAYLPELVNCLNLPTKVQI
jgi:hypothetical protein